MQMCIKEQLKRAQEIAIKAHKGQRYGYGHPYEYHLRKVADGVSSEKEKTVAWLHDLMEDHYQEGYNEEYLQKQGFSDEVIDALNAITFHENEVSKKKCNNKWDAYHDYIQNKVNPNELARAVKISDLKCNMDVSHVSKKELKSAKDRVEKKYKPAYKILTTIGFIDSVELFKKPNFLYNLIYECNDYKKEKFKNIPSKKGIKQSAELERQYQDLHIDWSIHNNDYAISKYKECGLHIFKPTIGNPNDMLTSNIQEEKGCSAIFAKENACFQAVMHTIGNTITAKENWKNWREDFIYFKLDYIMLHHKADMKSNHEAIKKAYLNHYKKKETLLRELYLVDAWDYENKCPKKSLDENQPGTIEANTKFIIQRGYRMQLKYKECEFTSAQQDELQKIFDAFKFKDLKII